MQIKTYLLFQRDLAVLCQFPVRGRRLPTLPLPAARHGGHLPHQPGAVPQSTGLILSQLQKNQRIKGSTQLRKLPLLADKVCPGCGDRR